MKHCHHGKVVLRELQATAESVNSRRIDGSPFAFHSTRHDLLGVSKVGGNYFVLFVLSVLLCGCSRGPRTYPVTGKVVFDDGTPLTSGGVVFTELIVTEGQAANARGAIDEEGRFRLTTFKDNDGALPGKHRFLVRADRDADDYIKRGIIPRPVIDERFESYDSSGLEFTVEQGENEFTLVVEPPGKSTTRRR